MALAFAQCLQARQRFNRSYSAENRCKDGNVIGTDYYVGIYTNGPDGKGPAFDQINEVAGEFAAIIKDEKIVDFMVSDEAEIPFDEGTVRLGSAEVKRQPGATGHIKGQLTVVVYDGYPGEIPANLMQDKKPGFVYPGEIPGHELGHARDIMTGRDPYKILGLDAGSIRMGNKVRKLHDPTASIRLREK